MKWLIYHCFVINYLTTSYIRKGQYLKDYNIRYSDFCPNASLCPNNTEHTICKHNDSKPILTLRNTCVEGVSGATLKDDHKNIIVQEINRMRALASKGEDTRLPKAYGLYKIEWNDQLAVIAQILANGCIFKPDTCRYTYNFLNPDCVRARMKFTYPDWRETDKTKFTDKPGFSDKVVEAMIRSVMAVWYSERNKLTPSDVKKYPGPNQNAGLVYLKVINGGLTHIGCGISGYKNMRDPKDIHNSMLLVCNLSAVPKPKQSVYPVTQPKNTDKDGCPIGHPMKDGTCSAPPLTTIPALKALTIKPETTSPSTTQTANISTKALATTPVPMKKPASSRHCPGPRFILIPVIQTKLRKKVEPALSVEATLSKSPKTAVTAEENDNEPDKLSVNIKDSIKVSHNNKSNGWSIPGLSRNISKKLEIEIPYDILKSYNLSKRYIPKDVHV